MSFLAAFLTGFLVTVGMMVTACIVVWEIWIAIRWVAEDIVEPAFWWLNDRLLRVHAWYATEEWLLTEELKDVQPPG